MWCTCDTFNEIVREVYIVVDCYRLLHIATSLNVLVGLCIGEKICSLEIGVEFAQSETWGCGRMFAGIEDSNPAGGMDVFIDLCEGQIPRPEES